MRLLKVARKFLAPISKTTAIAFAGLLSFQQTASALSYSTTGAPTQIQLGDTLGSASVFDILRVAGASGTIGPSTTQIVLNTLTFTAGVNAIVPATYNGVYSFAENVTIGTGSAALVVPFNLSINYSDTLTVVGGTTIDVAAGNSIWQLVINSLTIGPNSGGSEIGYLTAQVTDLPSATPLPAAGLLFGSGLSGMAFLRWRRKKRTSAVAAA